jgi:signal transduction histidine kinase
MYEQVYAENEFLAITNATVSHELRNPLQSITSQNLKIKLCLKELMNILKTKQSSSVMQIDKSVREIVTMISQSNKISDSSTGMMGFLVDDLLDFAQINAGKFRKVCKEFDLREAVDEMISIQHEKALM